MAIARGADGIDYRGIANAAALAFVSGEERSPDAVPGVTIDSLGLAT